MTQTEVLLTPLQLVKKYQCVSRSTIYAACADGTLPHYRVAARKGARGKDLVKQSDFLAWLEGQKVEAREEDDGAFARHRG